MDKKLLCGCACAIFSKKEEKKKDLNKFDIF